MAPVKHLLVDGPNILHAWAELRALLKRDRGAARQELARRLGSIHDAEGVRVTLVFDGAGPELVVEGSSSQAAFAVLQTPAGVTADDIIEQLVGGAAKPGGCWVATADQAERRTITALGAMWVPPEELAAWAERAERQLTAQVDGLRRNNAQKWRGASP